MVLVTDAGNGALAGDRKDRPLTSGGVQGRSPRMLRGNTQCSLCGCLAPDITAELDNWIPDRLLSLPGDDIERGIREPVSLLSRIGWWTDAVSVSVQGRHCGRVVIGLKGYRRERRPSAPTPPDGWAPGTPAPVAPNGQDAVGPGRPDLSVVPHCPPSGGCQTGGPS